MCSLWPPLVCLSMLAASLISMSNILSPSAGDSYIGCASSSGPPKVISLDFLKASTTPFLTEKLTLPSFNSTRSLFILGYCHSICNWFSLLGSASGSYFLFPLPLFFIVLLLFRVLLSKLFCGETF